MKTHAQRPAREAAPASRPAAAPAPGPREAAPALGAEESLQRARRLGHRVAAGAPAAPPPGGPRGVRRAPVAVSPAPAGRVQRMVGPGLMVGDPVILREHGRRGKILTAHLDGKYFVGTYAGPGAGFGDLDGTYTLAELDYVPDYDYQGRDSGGLPPMGFGKKIKIESQENVDVEDLKGDYKQHTLSDSSLFEAFEDEEEMTEGEANLAGWSDGWDDGYDDGYDGGEETWLESWNAAVASRFPRAYEAGYREGYDEGYEDGAEEVEEAEVDLEEEEAQLGPLPRATTEKEARRRKQRAQAYFEDFVTRTQPRTGEIAEKLLAIRDHFGLSAVTHRIVGDSMTVAFYASPPSYTHLDLVKLGPTAVSETAHPVSAATATKPSLTPKQVDKKEPTPLGAITTQLGLSDTDVHLLAKGDALTADRPLQVHAVVVGPRRPRGGRSGGAIAPAVIAHLGHHENMILNPDESTWIGYYDGGHLIGDQLMPKGKPDTFVEWNLAPMEQVLNQQSYLGYMENVIRAGAVPAAGKATTTVPISVLASVYYPSKDFKVKESDLAKSGFIPNDGTIAQKGNMPGPGGAPSSGKDRTVTIPSRIPFKWVLDAKIQKPAHTFVTKVGKQSGKSKSGGTAFPYFDYSDLTTSEIPFADRHWWVVKGAKKDVAKQTITLPAKVDQLHFEAYQYAPKR